MHSRQLAATIQKRLKEANPRIQVVLGPRQVGKTTALRTAIPEDAVYISADAPMPPPAEVIEQGWREAEGRPSRILAIDEAQKVPGWTEVIKKLWDEPNRRIKLVVTGSSALLLEKGLKETLAGRFELLRAEHWNWNEAQNVFGLSLSQYIEFGCYPGSMEYLGEVSRWSAYIRDSIVEPAIGRDLLLLHPVQHPALLRQLFGLALTAPAQVVSFQKLLGQIQERGTVQTLQAYLRLLQDAFLLTGVEKFSASAFRVKRSSPKLIIHDNGLIRAFERPVGASLAPEKLGHYFENAVGARLIEAGWDVYYWKERDLEVDFVVHGPGGEKWALEVKSALAAPSELKGLTAFCRAHPEYEPCLLSLVGQSAQGVRKLNAQEILSLKRE